jgi:ATP phosphoribosyltransferase
VGVKETERLRVAMQKSGRLADASLELLRHCGLHVSKTKNALYSRIEELPIDVLLVRDDNIPSFVSDGVCDLGIVGRNVLEEVMLRSGHDRPSFPVESVLPLGFSRCRVSIAVPESSGVRSTIELGGARVATSYPATLGHFLDRNGVSAEIVEMTGSVELAPRLKIADAICDVVSTGATLDANQLVEIATVVESEALLIKRQNGLSESKFETAERLIRRVRGVIRSANTKYIMMNAPASAVDAIASVLPGADAPTVMPLAGTGEQVAIHAVCEETVFWETMEKLKSVGARAILVLPIERMMA